MDIQKRVIISTLVPIIPGMIRLVLLNKLSLSQCADKQDARVELVVYILRAFASIRKSVKVLQDRSLVDSGIKGQMWISKIAAPADTVSPFSVRDAVVKGIQLLGDGTEQYDLPGLKDVEAEWTGFRKEADKKTPRMELGSEEEHYKRLMQEVTSDVTVLYFHGGAHIMMDPSSHRPLTHKLAGRTGGRCLSVRYRLAPQNPFPAALIDALTTYLYLLAPPPGSYHDPVPASKIVFAGDSAGGNLASALILLLLTLKNNGGQTLSYHGKDVVLDLPAGMALNSPWCDIGRSLPSVRSNEKYDYLDAPGELGLPAKPLPPDSIWPSTPPRAELYCTASLLMHPLASPVLATPQTWQGCPPTFVCGGSEGLLDEYTVMSRNIYLANTPVVFEAYEGMPHCFALILPTTPQGQDCLQKWAKFCSDAVADAVNATGSKLETNEETRKVVRKDMASWWKAKTKNPMVFSHVSIAEMGPSDAVVREKLLKYKEIATERERKDLEKYRTGQLPSTEPKALSQDSSEQESA